LVLRRLRRLLTMARCLPATFRFNFTYFPLAVASRLPVIVSHRVWLDHLAGSVELTGGIRTGMIRIGFGDVGIFDRQRSRSVWRVDGRVVFEGPANLGHGTRLSVERAGTVIFGSGFVITAESSIACRKAVSFGRGVLVSWDVLIMDSDWHAVMDPSGRRLNPDADVVVGNHVWIGCRSMILKAPRRWLHPSGGVGHHEGVQEPEQHHRRSTRARNAIWDPVDMIRGASSGRRPVGALRLLLRECQGIGRHPAIAPAPACRTRNARNQKTTMCATLGHQPVRTAGGWSSMNTRPLALRAAPRPRFTHDESKGSERSPE